MVWRKPNPMPNFRGRRFTNAHETMIWAARDAGAKGYTFNYEALKAGNEDVQVRSDWTMPLCTGAERLKDADGSKPHPTQKPEALLARVILSASRPGDLVLDPFFGTGTTGAVAKRLGRQFIGIERDPAYAAAAEARIAEVEPLPESRARALHDRARSSARAVHGAARARHDHARRGAVDASAAVTGAGAGRRRALARRQSSARSTRSGRSRRGCQACNGWTFWHVERDKKLTLIDGFRAEIREALAAAAE